MYYSIRRKDMGYHMGKEKKRKGELGTRDAKGVLVIKENWRRTRQSGHSLGGGPTRAKKGGYKRNTCQKGQTTRPPPFHSSGATVPSKAESGLSTQAGQQGWATGDSDGGPSELGSMCWLGVWVVRRQHTTPAGAGDSPEEEHDNVRWLGLGRCLSVERKRRWVV